MHFDVTLPVVVLREGKYFIAHSPVLDLSTSGKSFEETKKRFEEVVGIFFEELMAKRTLNKVLADLGWKRIDKKWEPPVVISQESESFRLRIPA